MPFVHERRKIRGVENLVCTIEDKEECPIHIRALKQALKHGSVLKRVQRAIQFNQKAWLKPDIDMNTKYRKKIKK